MLLASPIEVEFLVDTGSAITVLQANELTERGVDLASILSGPMQANLSQSGPVVHSVKRGEIGFLHDDGRRVELRLDYRVAPVSIGDVPSVLGMDVLELFRVIVSLREGRVEFQEPFV